MPARLVLNVLMSDAVDAFSPAGSSSGTTPFTGDPSKSVSAYQTLSSLQAARQPLTVTTRLRTYTNMLIVGLEPREDYRTITGLRIPVEFEEIFTGSTDTPADSARTNTTDSTGVGDVAATPADSTLTSQYAYPPQTAAPQYQAPGSLYANPLNSPTSDPFSSTPLINLPGAGSFTSTPGQQSLP
jgi:hypothetical protein